VGPLFTLLTDFGDGSGYPAQMKGVLLAAAPDARIVDLSHGVPAFDVLAGSLLLESCVPWFPSDAIHIAVVDPGVGTSRRALCLVDAHGRRLVGPDNGLLTPFLEPGSRVHALEANGILPEPRSVTFHGRDLFAPAAAWLARGGDPARLGPVVADPVRLRWPEAHVSEGEIEGEVLAADRFGNLVTSIRERDIATAGTGPVRGVFVAGRPIRWVRTFGEGAPGELLAMIGSGGRVEVAVREGSAASGFLRFRGLKVRVSLRG
jgi:S-adenosylmethionine hydrolase